MQYDKFLVHVLATQDDCVSITLSEASLRRISGIRIQWLVSSSFCLMKYDCNMTVDVNGDKTIMTA